MSRPRFQFRLPTLLAALAVFLVGLGLLADRGHRQARAVASIEALGGNVSYQGGTGSGGGLFRWLEGCFGKNLVRSVSAVYLPGRPIDDTDLDCLAELTALETVILTSTPLTDGGLERLSGLKRLKHVDVRFTQVSPEAVDRLRAALPNAKVYSVSDIE